VLDAENLYTNDWAFLGFGIQTNQHRLLSNSDSVSEPNPDGSVKPATTQEWEIINGEVQQQPEQRPKKTKFFDKIKRLFK
jgi:hypothetical protein